MCGIPPSKGENTVLYKSNYTKDYRCRQVDYKHRQDNWAMNIKAYVSLIDIELVQFSSVP